MQIVIISQNQMDNIPGMLTATRGHTVCYVLDRCTDGSNIVKFPSNVKKIVNSEGQGFLAGKMRDLGASFLDNTKPILFLDGDKTPHGDLSVLERLPFSAVCLGTTGDSRAWIRNGEGAIPWGKDFRNPNNDIYSCGIFLNPDAIKAARKHSKSNRIFHEAFDGTWGEEDRYLGDVLHQEGLKIGYTSRVTLEGEISRLTPEKEIAFSRNWIKRLRMTSRIAMPEEGAPDTLLESVDKVAGQHWFTNKSKPLRVTLK